MDSNIEKTKLSNEKIRQKIDMCGLCVLSKLDFFVNMI